MKMVMMGIGSRELGVVRRDQEKVWKVMGEMEMEGARQRNNGGERNHGGVSRTHGGRSMRQHVMNISRK
jgi:hypothetical protein